MKLAPVGRALGRRAQVRHTIVHTGQHYDHEMSRTFFEELGIAEPDYNLEVGSDSHARQTARIMERIEPILLDLRPDVVVVYGDVNSTVAAALVAAKLGIAIAHVEAGLRSGDWTMPEEVNRVLTDRLANLLLTPSRDADANLRREGVPEDRIHFVGNVMIDTLVAALPRARTLGVPQRMGLQAGGYALATLHRPSNVDDPATLHDILEALGALARRLPVLFPVHPRTRSRLNGALVPEGLRLLEPRSYLEMLSLTSEARLVITDSGGLQEETSYLGIPCVTIRPSTERPVTVSHGTNRLVAPERDAILRASEHAMGCWGAPAPRIEKWDGKAAERIADVLLGDVRS